METYVISAVFLDYENITKDQIRTLDAKYLIGEIKILLLSPNSIIPSFPLSMIRLFAKQNKAQCIKEDIRKTLGVKSKTMFNVREMRFSADNRFQKLKLPVVFVFLKSTECEKHLAGNSLKTKFVPISDLNNITIGEQSMDYICAIHKWIKSESIKPLSLLELFKPCKRGDALIGKSKRAQSGKSSDREGYKYESEALHKSTSLDVIARPELVSSSSGPTKQEVKNAQVTATRRSQILKSEVITNPLITNHLDYCSHSDIVHRPDFSRIRTPSKTLFHKEHSVFRSRSWSLDFPLHFAAYKGDMLLVSPLVGKGYSCMERDYAG